MDKEVEQAFAESRQEIERAIAESIALGNMTTDGKTYSLTVKGMTHAALLQVHVIIARADDEKRDFTADEKLQIIKYMNNAIKALQK